MRFVERFELWIRRAESPFSRLVKGTCRKLLQPTSPRFPRPVLVPFRLVYRAHFLAIAIWRSLLTTFYSSPAFQARCASFGRRVKIEGLPFVDGPVEIHVGDEVVLGGKVCILSGAVCDRPRLVMKDRAGVGWGTVIAIGREVVLEEDVIVSVGCRISDTDGHPREADLRAARMRPDPRDVRPVRICRGAWIGAGCHVLKGVTVGEGAIVAANSVVATNVPPYALAMGNPAEIILRNCGLPRGARRGSAHQATPSRREAP